MRILPGCLIALMFLVGSARADFPRRDEFRAGLEVNLLWILPPFRTYEVRAFVGVASNVELSLGYGLQKWSYAGDQLTPGTIHSDGLITGARYYLPHNRNFLDYSAWWMKDEFVLVDGEKRNGPALSHEFFVGHQIGGGQWSWSPGINFGFYSHRPYVAPRDDRGIWTIVPKISGRYEGR